MYKETYGKKIGNLASGEEVYDRSISHTDIKLIKLVRQALTKINSGNKPYIEEEILFPKIIGKCDMVETDSSSKIIFAQRKNRKGLSRFVLNKQSEDSKCLAVVLKKIEEFKYILITSFIGRITEPEPFDPKATEKSKKFWKTHAFVWGSKEIVE